MRFCLCLYLRQSVRRTTDNKRPVAREVDATDRITMRRKLLHDLSPSYIPQKHSLIVRSACQDVAFRRKSDAVDVIVVAPQRGHLLARDILPSHRLWSTGYSIPQSNRLVVGTTGQSLAIRTPSNAVDAGHMAYQSIHMATGIGGPYLACAVG